MSKRKKSPTNKRPVSPSPDHKQPKPRRKSGVVKKVISEQKDLFLVVGGVVVALLSMSLPAKIALIVQVGIAVVFVVSGALGYVRAMETYRQASDAPTNDESQGQASGHGEDAK